ncbi:thiocillin/thiostrepton family thiazolyl peptide [Nocardiopsis suaedae]|uniref:Thiocillin/thiostrepton family thiazolyl peptide n=1 Tax=Nocardiopsis suaedae TaxID=3018444 RepID=A0ABT4TJ01_9ACTN|nr:thiocillin/thiostrepton family thiazolyl peptide [Nocardiopsis suaedae]MDA2804673.1 thiocillin/thiostrepton family thiazolyl peptide [Nocardiopsis suaedae]
MSETNAAEIDLSAVEISDLLNETEQSDEALSQVMAASCTTTGCACSSSSSST